MTTRRSRFLLLIAASCLAFTSCSGGDDVSLQGAGATFPAPLYKRWFLEYYKAHPEVRVNYQAIGSGAGIRQFSQGLVDFGASDAAMSDKQLDDPQVRGNVQLLPMTAGSIVISYNLPGNPPGLKLSRDALARIALGEITSWNDPAISKHNPQLELPDAAIKFVRRSEGSGTTFAFTNHLAATSAAWKKSPGVGTAVSWPVGVGAKGNSGVAALIKQMPGAIGYLEYGYADLAELPMAALENKAGRFVAPNQKSGQAALEGKPLPENLRLFLPDPEGEGAYPLVTYTWLLCRRHYDDPRVSQTLKEVLRYCLTDGQALSADLGYTPLTPDVARQVLEAVDRITP
jgi:phosphate transport system substrate-binding protein